MPQGNLPKKARDVYLKAEATAKKTCPEGDEECIAKKSWAAVKRGWKKEGDKWISKSTAEFSLYIHKASFNKTTQEMKWFAVASDIEPDSYDDEMSLELYADFLRRIESKELPPERHRSEYWSGGIPYLSISHYLDLDGSGVPGPTDEVFVDGKCLKADGRFNNTVLGKACFDAVCNDLYGEEKSKHENAIRISIAFVDWGHVHKSNGYEFKRESLDDYCPECLKEHMTGEGEGKIFKRGHLIHLALTRVPVNERTKMEVRSMTTQKEDAASIVGEELAEEIAEKAKDELKADLVIKSEVEEPEIEEKAETSEEEDDEEEEKKKKDKEEEKAVIEPEPVEVIEPHALSDPIDLFLSQYDEVSKSNLGYNEKLQAIQNGFEQLGEAIKSSFAPTTEEKEVAEISELKGLVQQLAQTTESLVTEIAILKQQGMTVEPKQAPVEKRRSLQLDTSRVFQEPARTGKPMKVGDFVNRSVRGYQ